MIDIGTTMGSAARQHEGAEKLTIQIAKKPASASLRAKPMCGRIRHGLKICNWRQGRSSVQQSRQRHGRRDNHGSRGARAVTLSRCSATARYKLQARAVWSRAAILRFSLKPQGHRPDAE